MKTALFIATSLFCSLATYGAQIILGQNAILNPGAEAGPASATGDDIIAAPGWSSTGGFTVVALGAVDAPVPPNPFFGNNFFSGGPGFDTSTGTQTIDVSNLSSLIDINGIVFVLSGYFGGYLTQPDNATLKATFFDSTNTKISALKIGGITAADRGDETALIHDQGSGFIPVGTRSILITLQMNRLQYSYNDGYADNLSFVAQATPEPGTWTMLALGCGLVGLRKPLARARSRR